MTIVRSKQQVVDVAAKVFREKGYEATKLEDIAAELGILQGSLYYHIDSKASLLREVRVQMFEEITEQIEKTASGDGPAVEKLRLVIVQYVRYLERVLPLIEHWIIAPADKRKTKKHAREDRALSHRLREVWLSILREGVDAGEIRSDLDLNVVMLSIIGICNSIGRWYDPSGDLSIDEIAKAQFDICWGGISG
ncbi:TetR/AcrR family transcriptional regulator [Rhodococcus sp. KBS0724]|uniref:TetR/AcrR family transcriptional regulator n=1 Tax=Rhodococcus sp. KBS0724 TaxID=1179674 RepID=UPI00110D81BA|nr:TetR/AcrR family transcriptional regulator [Rhodococcus sp. KBS0724]TSD40367.1 TetR/AcrR family transcriptional regulator [Rhodococcus sp. KBS0724]